MKYYQHGETGRVVATEAELIGEWYEIEKDQYEDALHPLSRPTPRAADVLVRCAKCYALIETTVHCDNCGTFEPTRR